MLFLCASAKITRQYPAYHENSLFILLTAICADVFPATIIAFFDQRVMKKGTPLIVPFLLLSILALLTGLWAGLARLGWAIPVPAPALPAQHGTLMISGFLGTLISLERVAALRQRWMYAAPLLSGLGWLVSLVLPGIPAGMVMITLGSLVFVGILAVMVRRETKIYTITMAAGALCWLAGNLLWLSGAVLPRLVWLWAAFLVLTIAGERLELNRVLRLRPAHHRMFTAAAAVFVTGAVLFVWQPNAGARVTAIGMLALAIWLLYYDIARRNLRHKLPLTRFIAACLFFGYLWLGVGGALLLGYGAQVAGFRYDAMLHVVFVGFVFSMIFGHAPIILPALTGINVIFRPAFYLPLALLHTSLVLRVIGDLAALPPARLWGGILNETAVLGFFALFASTVLQSRRS